MRLRENPVVNSLVVEAGMSSSSGITLQRTRPSIVPMLIPHCPPGVRCAVRWYHASRSASSRDDNCCATAGAAEVPVAALDLALFNFGQAETSRATMGSRADPEAALVERVEAALEL